MHWYCIADFAANCDVKSVCSILYIFSTANSVTLVDGRQAVYEAVIGALKKYKPADRHQLLHYALDILGKRVEDGTSLKLIRSIEILPLLSNLPESNIENYKSVVRQFLVFMDCTCKTIVSLSMGD